VTRIVIIGAGGFGREVFGIISAISQEVHPWVVVGFVDDHPMDDNAAGVHALGSRILGTVADLAVHPEPPAAVIAVSSPPARATVVRALSLTKVLFPTLIHPDATVGPQIALGEGVVIAAGARLSTNIAVGRHVHIDQNVTVGHDVVLEEYCRLNPQACVSGSVRVGASAVIGANATVIQGLQIGESATVGAGAVVTRCVAPGEVVKGVPAR
jgi:sugar O-acyltransferase (sialic acid O-acetyltransferase NeuD family)